MPNLGSEDSYLEEIQSVRKISIFNQSNHHYLLALVSIFITRNRKDIDGWNEKSIQLFSLISELAVLLNPGHIDYVYLKDLLSLEKLTQTVYGTDIINTSLHENLKNYLHRLPGWSEKTVERKNFNQSTIDHHGYIISNIIMALNNLKKIEEEDILLFHPLWLDKNDIESSYQKAVNRNIIGSASGSSSGSIYKTEPENMKSILDINLTHSSQFKDSWLSDDNFGIIIKHYNEEEMIYLSDILISATKIVNQYKQQIFLDCVFHLLNNYQAVKDLSHEINTLVYKEYILEQERIKHEKHDVNDTLNNLDEFFNKE